MSSKLYLFTKIVLVLAVMIVLPMRGAVAQTPAAATIPYPGHLSDDAGNPVPDGAYDLNFSFYDTVQGGSLLWSEMQPRVVVQSGAFTVNLGSVYPLPASTALSKLWLEVSLRGPGESAFTRLAPRQAVSSILPPAAVSTAGTCAHTHFGESWTGNSSSSGVDSGLHVTNTAADGIGLSGTADNSFKISAKGVSGESAAGVGVYGQSTSGQGVYGSSNTAQGVYGQSTKGDGIEGVTSASNTSGVYGHSDTGYGVTGRTSSKDASIAAVQGVNSGNGIGVYGSSSSSAYDIAGVQGVTSGEGDVGYGVYGLVNAGGSGFSEYDATAGVAGRSFVIGASGGFFEGVNGPGAFIDTDNRSAYDGAQIEGNLTIIAGVCHGCALTYTGLNSGTAAIPTGSLVAIAGVKVDASTQQPILLVQEAAQPGDVIIGVAVGAAADPAQAGRSGPDTPTDSIAPGQYVQVMVSGLAQVKVTGKVGIGNYLAPGGAAGAAIAAVDASPVRVMSVPDENGLVWVMVVAH